MSIWISKAALGLGLLLVSACVPEFTLSPARSASVLGGAVSIGVPSGYCIDRSASRTSGDNAIVLMGRCSDGASTVPALITVAVGEAGSAAVLQAGGPALATFFASSQGRAMLSRSGRPGDVRVLQAVGTADAFLLHVEDRALGEYWRGVTQVKGRLVTVSAKGAAGLPLAPAVGRTIVDSTLTAMRAANPAKGA